MATLLYLGIFRAFLICVYSWTLVVRLFDLMSTLVLVAQCRFLHNLLMLNISFGCCRHSVSNTVVQLTEGRSARDNPSSFQQKKNTIYIPGGNTLISSRVLSVTCLRTMLETSALGELRSRFRDLRVVGFRVIPVHR